MRLKEKLKENTGASITYALLLFLVCAIVSSVVLTAATAASGRMSRAVESDQRYYAVSSAASLIKDMLDGKSCVLKMQSKQEKNAANEVVTVPVADSGSVDGVTEGITIVDGEVEGGTSLVAVLSEAAVKAKKRDTESHLKFTITSDGNPDLSVNAVVEVGKCTGEKAASLGWTDGQADKPDALMSIWLYNLESDTISGTFAICMNFTADVEERDDKKGKEGTDSFVINNVKKVTWNYYNISTAAALPSWAVS